MKILLTGATGFLGKHLYQHLNRNFEVLRLGRAMENEVPEDITQPIVSLPSVNAVVHAAGKAHIYPKTREEKEAFFQVNTAGTDQLLKALQKSDLRYFVFISSVSVYGLSEGEGILETQNTLAPRAKDGTYLGAPYAVSKVEAENLVRDYCEANKVHYLILRLPLIAGHNPPGNLGKMIKGIRQGTYLRIAKGQARKSMVLAEDVAALISTWLQNESPKSGTYNLTDGYHPSFFELEETIRKGLGKSGIWSIPPICARILGKIGDVFATFPVNTNTIKKITCSFTFSDEKARQELGWNPRRVLDHIDEMVCEKE